MVDVSRTELDSSAPEMVWFCFRDLIYFELHPPVGAKLLKGSSFIGAFACLEARLQRDSPPYRLYN